jgi:hypothetical protein
VKHREEERPGRFITFHHAFWGAQTMEAAVAGTGPIALIYGLGSRVRTLFEADLVEGGVVPEKPTTPGLELLDSAWFWVGMGLSLPTRAGYGASRRHSRSGREGAF